MSISCDSIIAQRALAPENPDTLHVHWSLLHSCNYQCAYCYQPRGEEDCVLVKDRLLSMAHRLLEQPRPCYSFTLTGGEPTLHPRLPEILSYLYSSGRKLGVTVETNGSRDLPYFRQLLQPAPEYSLRLRISVHPAYADLAHILFLTATIAEARQLAHLQIVCDPERREAARLFHDKLTRLRAVVPFTLALQPLMQPLMQPQTYLDMDKLDPRYTEADFRWWRAAADSFAAAVAASPAPCPDPPLAVPRSYPEEALIKWPEEALSYFVGQGAREFHEGGLDFFDPAPRGKNRTTQPNEINQRFLYCCIGTNLVHVDARGRFYGALCDMVPNNPPLWRAEGKAAVANAARIVRCRKEHCPGGLNALLPKFRDEQAARTHMAAQAERALLLADEAAPLRDPIHPEPDSEQVVRARLKRLKPVSLAEGEERPLLPPCPDFARRRMEDIRKVYDALADAPSRDSFLRGIQAIVTGDTGYLADAAYARFAHPEVLEEDGEIYFSKPGRFCTYIRLEENVEDGEDGEDGGHGATVKYDENGIKTAANQECGMGLKAGVSDYKGTEDERAAPGAGERLRALRGTLRQHLPKLHIALRHHPEHYLDAPLWLLTTFPAYRLYMGQHAPHYAETLLYALPPERPERRPLPLEKAALASEEEPRRKAQARPAALPTVSEELRREVEEKLRTMTLLRRTVERIDPATTAIVCFGDTLEEAIAHYAAMQPPLAHLPNFVLADWDGAPRKAWKQSAREHAVSIVPMQQRDRLQQKNFCLYARKHRGAWVFYLPLVRRCSANGMQAGYCVDAACFAEIAWRNKPNPQYVRQRLADICAVYAALADEASRDVFLRAMKSMETGDPGYLPLSPYPQYAHPEVTAALGDVVIEGGLESGLTTQSFAGQVGGSGRVVGFEPLLKACAASQNQTKDCPNVTIEHLGLWSGANTFYIEDNAGGSRMVTTPTDRSEECRSIDLDSYMEQKSLSCQLIKLDIEGAEMECLKGAARTIGRDKPKLHISLYHSPSHYLDIPLWLLSEFLGYTLYMGHHSTWYGETCLYALPSQCVIEQSQRTDVPVHRPLVSLIVPTHNNEDTLKRCLDSALIQGVRDLELVVIDDASTDKTPEIIAEYLRRYPQIVRSIRFAENKGPGPARNAGMDMARGTYLAFIDSDDMLAHDFVRRGLEVMQQEDADIVAFDMVVSSHWKKEEELWGVEPGTCGGEESLRRFLLKKAGCYGTYSRLYNADMLARCNVRYGETRHEDIVFNVQAFFYSEKTVILPDVGYYRYIRKGSMSITYRRDKDFFGFTNFVYFLTCFFEDQGLSTEDEMYRYCIGRVYHWDRDRVFAAITRAEKENRLRQVLTKENLLKIGSSKEALSCILADYALLYCHRKGLHPTVAPKDLDWQAAAVAPRPPKTCTAYGDADNPVGPAPLLSVIVPNYNKAPYLKKCLHSILGQSMRDFELIIIDDASTDESCEILQDYADAYPCIRLYKMAHNTMQCVCRNIGMEKARGKYIIFVDSDDSAEQEFFSIAIDTIEKNNSDIAVFAFKYTYENGNVEKREMKTLSCSSKLAIQHYINGDISPEPWAKIYNRIFLQQNHCKFPENVYCENQIFIIKALQFARLVISKNCIVYNCTSQDLLQRHTYRRYMHAYSAYSFYKYFQNIMEEIFSDNIYSVQSNHIQWNLENRLLLACAALWRGAGAIPMTIADHALLQKATLFIDALCAGYARCRAQGPFPAEALPAFPKRLMRTFIPATQNPPLISVIVPTYNQEACIARCLDSILTQSLRNLELIVINDASTDKTLDICLAYQAKDPRVRVYSNESNKGQGYSRNRAQELAQGKYISYVDSDDYIFPHFLLHGVVLLEHAEHLDMVHFSFKKIDEKGNLIQDVRCKNACMTGKEAALAYITGKHKGWSAWSKIYRASLLKENNIISPHIFYEDEIFIIKAYYHSQTVLFENQFAYAWVQTLHDASTINPIQYTKKHIDGLFSCGKLRENLVQKYFPSANGQEVLQTKNKYYVDLWKKCDPYIVSFANAAVSPLTDANLDDLKGAPELFRALLNDYAALYARHNHYTPALPPEDRDPLYEQREPASRLIPLPLHKEQSDSVILSVIVPAYNTASTLPRCLNSVLEQGIANVEIILVEDCSSTDETLAVCKQFTRQYNCIRLFQTPWNSGLGTVRNLAMEQARGTYITFVDSDDWLAPNFLHRGLRLMRKNPQCDLVDFSWCAWDDMKNEQMYYSAMPDKVEIDSKTALQWYGIKKYNNYGAWAKLYKKTFLDDNHITFGTTYNEDECFLLTIFSLIRKMQFSDIVSYYYVRKATQHTIMNPKYRGKKYFESVLHNLQSAHEFCTQRLGYGESSPEYKSMMTSFLAHHHRQNLLQYIHACNMLALPSPLTDTALAALTLSKDFMRKLLMDYALLSQKPLPEQKNKS